MPRRHETTRLRAWMAALKGATSGHFEGYLSWNPGILDEKQAGEEIAEAKRARGWASTPVSNTPHLHFSASSSPHVPERSVSVANSSAVLRVPRTLLGALGAYRWRYTGAVRLPYLTLYRRVSLVDQPASSYICLFNPRYESPFPILDFPIALRCRPTRLRKADRNQIG